MRTIIIGGFWDNNTPKPSKLLHALSFESIEIRNGGTVAELQELAAKAQEYDLVLWMPNIKNEHEDIFPTKKVGGILIVSKVLRENRGRADAVQRIFKFHGNATIAINKQADQPYEYELIDALNNTWIKTGSFEEVILKCQELYTWTAGTIREGTHREMDKLDRLLELNKRVADQVRAKQERFFRNLSTRTRCASLFPSFNNGNSEVVLVSARNTNKQTLGRTDMVIVYRDKDKMLKYFGERKPSVDTPVQIDLYAQLPQLKYIIHGHNEVIGAETTEIYFPCGDKREVEEVMKLMKDDTFDAKAINIKNHGFLIMGNDSDAIENLIDTIKFKDLQV